MRFILVLHHITMTHELPPVPVMAKHNYATTSSHRATASDPMNRKLILSAPLDKRGDAYVHSILCAFLRDARNYVVSLSWQ